MLSLLPPLKTREISPRYNYTVGRKVKETHQRVIPGSCTCTDGEHEPDPQQRKLRDKKDRSDSIKASKKSVKKIIKNISIN